MIKRLFDFCFALCGMIILSPILLPVILLIWFQDFRSPFYLAPRMRRKNEKFTMVKLRSMIINADQVGGTSTSVTDQRVTSLGKFIRKLKLDEFSQLWNVMMGDMSLVGPRPQAEFDARLYTEEENDLFNLRPGITDFSSIVFSDEGEILASSENPDLKYNQLIRPWKSRLGLFYVNNQSIWVDISLIVLTLISVISRPIALRGVQFILKKLGASKSLVQIAGRTFELVPKPPPGSDVVENLC